MSVIVNTICKRLSYIQPVQPRTKGKHTRAFIFVAVDAVKHKSLLKKIQYNKGANKNSAVHEIIS